MAEAAAAPQGVKSAAQQVHAAAQDCSAADVADTDDTVWSCWSETGSIGSMRPLPELEASADREAPAAQWEGWDPDVLRARRLAKRVICGSRSSNDTPAPGDHVKVHYTGHLRGGKVFDSSRERNKPLSLTLGEGSVIEGWEKGLLHVGLGERVWLLIAPEWAYAQHGYVDADGEQHIPPDSALLFDIELLAINGRKVSSATIPDPWARD